MSRELRGLSAWAVVVVGELKDTGFKYFVSRQKVFRKCVVGSRESMTRRCSVAVMLSKSAKKVRFAGY